jgi:PAS domain S-box-containing protein
MNDNVHDIFKLAAEHFFKKYRNKGGTQSVLAKKIGVSQSYISSVLSGTRTSSLELQSQIANFLYGPYEEFLAIGRRIMNGLDPGIPFSKEADDSVESLIARLSHYVVDHQRIEDELVRTKNFYKKITENLQSGVIVTDANGIMTYINNYMEKLIGVEAEKLIGTNQLEEKCEKFPNRDLGALMVYYREARELQKPIYYENVFVTSSGGKELWINGWMIPLQKENNHDGMIITIRNMTRIHNLNQSLLASLEFSGCPVAIALQDEKGGPATSYHMNREGMELMGISQFSFNDDNIKKSMLLSASLMKNGNEWLDFTKQNFKGRELAEMTIHMKDGRKFIWESKALRDQNRNYYGRIVHLREILRNKRKADSGKN